MFVIDPLLQAIILGLLMYQAVKEKQIQMGESINLRDGMKTGLGATAIACVLITGGFWLGIKIFFNTHENFANQICDVVISKGFSTEPRQEVFARISATFRPINWLRMVLVFGTFATVGSVFLLKRKKN